MANTNIKSGAVLGGGGGGSGYQQHGNMSQHVSGGASIASAVTFDTFDESFASFKDLNKSFVRGADLEDSVYDASVSGDPAVKKGRKAVKHHRK